MSNTLAMTTQHDNIRNLVVVVDIIGDGSGEETAGAIIDASTYSHMTDRELKLTKVQANLNGFSAQLLWDADTDVNAVRLAAGGNYLEFMQSGGLINRASTGKTGDMVLATTGLGAGDLGSIVLEFKKRRLT